MRDQFGNLATFYYKYKSTQDKKGALKKIFGEKGEIFWRKGTQKTLNLNPTHL